MNYNPPPLNDSASSAVKKAETALYGIQAALTQLKIPIDYFFHQRIQYNPGLDTTEDPEVIFASTIGALLSDVAATVTQDWLYKLHNGLRIPVKPIQLVEPDTKPLMDQESLNDLNSRITVAKSQLFSPFARSSRAQTTRIRSAETLLWLRAPMLQKLRKPLQITRPRSTPVSKGAQTAPFETGCTFRGAFGPTPSESLSNTNADVTIASIQEEVNPGLKHSYDRGNRFFTIKLSYRRDSVEGSRLLQPAVYDPKEY
ncbi:hypothetical protein AYI70_g11438 [Smittium culicis]|uniref:Uncharacterized protein n=1 Tax=Smittium culicis TaxID=133412 RepID=A0A1R1X1T5_9FUNG|nr:hypothetical protein AYI70_g11438 [Smittium culicis]